MKKVNLRKILTFVTATDIGLIFLMLSGVLTALFNLSPETSLSLLGIFFSLAPLLIIATLLSYVFGTAKPPKKNTKRRIKTMKIISAIVVIASVLSLYITYISTQISVLDEHRNKFVYENTGTAFIYIAYIAAAVLINMQQFVYWPIWSKKDREAADEREKSVRQRVFEKSYITIIGVLAAFGYLFLNGEQRFRQMLVVCLVIMILTIPAVIASFQKDS